MLAIILVTIPLFTQGFMKSLKMLLVRAAYEGQPRKLDYRMERLAQLSRDTALWLLAIPLEKWALSYDRGRRYRMMTTNSFEVFKQRIERARNVLKAYDDQLYPMLLSCNSDIS